MFECETLYKRERENTIKFDYCSAAILRYTRQQSFLFSSIELSLTIDRSLYKRNNICSDICRRSRHNAAAPKIGLHSFRDCLARLHSRSPVRVYTASKFSCWIYTKRAGDCGWSHCVEPPPSTRNSVHRPPCGRTVTLTNSANVERNDRLAQNRASGNSVRL